MNPGLEGTQKLNPLLMIFFNAGEKEAQEGARKVHTLINGLREKGVDAMVTKFPVVVLYTPFRNIYSELRSLSDNMDKKFEQVDRGFKKIDKKFEQVDTEVKKVNTEMHEKFEQVGTGFKKIDKKFEQADKNLDMKFNRLIFVLCVPLALIVLALSGVFR